MNLAVSNLAWPVEQDAAVASSLCALGVEGIEVAPTKVWPVPLEATDSQIDAYREFWKSRGIAIVAAQSLLFGQPHLTLFENPETRNRTLNYLRRMTCMCGRLGAQAMVFGSPANRRAGAAGREIVWQAAVDFFGLLGEAASAAGTAIVMEANPPAYGADFVTRAAQALELVRAVNQAGFLLHLDTACMTLAGDPVALIRDGIDVLRHFHISEPGLKPVGAGPVMHAEFARELSINGYSRWVSIEMREQQPFSLDALSDVVRYVSGLYLPQDGQSCR